MDARWLLSFMSRLVYMIASMELSEGQHSALMTTTWYVVILLFLFFLLNMVRPLFLLIPLVESFPTPHCDSPESFLL